MRTVFIITLMLLITAGSQAQIPADQSPAKIAYLKAEDAFVNGRYEKALGYLKQVEKALGESNARTEALRIKTLYGMGEYRAAGAAIQPFFQTKAYPYLINENTDLCPKNR